MDVGWKWAIKSMRGSKSLPILIRPDTLWFAFHHKDSMSRLYTKITFKDNASCASPPIAFAFSLESRKWKNDGGSHTGDLHWAVTIHFNEHFRISWETRAICIAAAAVAEFLGRMSITFFTKATIFQELQTSFNRWSSNLIWFNLHSYRAVYGLLLSSLNYFSHENWKPTTPKDF